MTDQPSNCRAILRIEKVTSLDVVQEIEKHLRRATDATDADPARVARWLVKPTEGTVLQAVEGRLTRFAEPPRAGSVLAMNILLSASPEVFRDPDQAPGTWDEGRVDAWAALAQGWLAGRHGDWLVASVLQRDGATPHIQGLYIPSADVNLLSVKALFDPFGFRDARKSYASALHGLGLERGLASPTATHAQAADDAEVSRAKGLPAITVADRARLLIGRLPSSVRDLRAVAEHARSLEATVQDQKRTIAGVMAERDRALRARDAARAVADGVRPIALARVMPLIGAEPTPSCAEAWMHPVLGRIDVSGQGFRVGERTGTGAIDLVRAGLGTDRGTAIRFIASHLPAGEVIAAHRRVAAEGADVEAKEALAAPITLADRLPALAADRQPVASYLEKFGVDPRVIRDAMGAGQVEATRHAGRVCARFRLVDSEGRVVGFAVQDVTELPAKPGEEIVVGERGTFRADHNEELAETGRWMGTDTRRIVVAGPAPIEVLRVFSVAPRLGLDHLTPGRYQPVTMLAHLGRDDAMFIRRTVLEVVRSGGKLWTCFEATDRGRDIEARIRSQLAEAEDEYSTVERLYDVLAAAKVERWLDVVDMMKSQPEHLARAMRGLNASARRNRLLRESYNIRRRDFVISRRRPSLTNT